MLKAEAGLEDLAPTPNKTLILSKLPLGAQRPDDRDALLKKLVAKNFKDKTFVPKGSMGGSNLKLQPCPQPSVKPEDHTPLNTNVDDLISALEPSPPDSPKNSKPPPTAKEPSVPRSDPAQDKDAGNSDIDLNDTDFPAVDDGE